MSLAAGSKIWVEDNWLAWVQAEVVEVDDQKVTARLESGKKLVVSISKIHPRDVDIVPGGVEDMIKLAYLHEAGVLYNLANRYELNDIYTYTGNILIAVNPFMKLPHLYDSHMMEQYKGMALGELNPHVFAIADSSYRAMINEGQSQAVLVSGESGAGKTETTKLVMQYLAYVGGRAASDGRTVEQQVLESNPLLEAFGNAKTVRNDNSSRFGKFVEIQFNSKGRISGAAIRTYLLERSRVVKITNPERNYHCFYQLCFSQDAVKYKLTDPKKFYYLNQSNCFTLSGMDEKKEYYRTRRAMDVMGINSREQDAIFRTLAAILHLGNVDFNPGKEHDSSILKDEKSSAHLQTAAELLMCDFDALKKTLCTRNILTGGESITKLLDPETAVINRDTLAKTVYSHLFDWLVEKINKSIGQDLESQTQIGVLDIYGFESFQINSFEQFCINFANEKLQQHFNEHVLKLEQEEYTKEGINWSYIDFIDNQDVLDLIEKKPLGIISLLDEACMFPKSTSETFSTMLFQTFKNHGCLRKPKLSSTEFILSHYAGEVTYQTEHFLDKNRDYVVVEHEDLLTSSKDSFVSGLFMSAMDENIRSCYKFSSVATRFKQQLQSLVETLSTTEPHYIRCVKPNNDNKPGRFENQSVIHQLRCGGVLEAVRISCSGYPTRRAYSDFLNRFGFLASDLLQGQLNKRSATKKLLERMGIKKFQLGVTKVFLKVGEIAKLDAQRAEALNRAIYIIQRNYRSFMRRKTFLAMRRATLCIQAHWRGHIARQLCKIKRQQAAAIFIQKEVRMWLSRRAFQVIRKAAILIQGRVRIFLLQQRRTTWLNATLKIQAQWRSWFLRMQFKHLKAAAISIQCAWRTKTARRELRKLKVEMGTLQEVKPKLQTHFGELTWCLQMEKRLRAGAEELKVLDITKLQAGLFEMQQKVETMGLVIANERETNTMLSMQLASLIEVRLLLEASEAKNYKLEKENCHLRILADIHESKAIEVEKELLTARKESEERLYKSKEVDMKISQVHQTLQRLEEKMFYLEIENQALRKKALAFTPTAGREGRAKPAVQQRTSYYLDYYSETAEDDQPLLQKKDRPAFSLQTSPVLSHAIYQTEQSLQKIFVDGKQGVQDMMINWITQDVGFDNGKPLAACILYKCMTHWHAFEAQGKEFLDHVAQTIAALVEVQKSYETLAYWLSNIATLVNLLQSNMKPGQAHITPQPRHAPVSLLGRMTRSFRSTSRSKGVSSSRGFGSSDILSQVEEIYPALHFKLQLIVCIEKLYGMLRDNLKKEISPLLTACIQAPRASLLKGHPLSVPSSTQTSRSSHWHSIIDSLNLLLSKLCTNHVPPFLICRIFTQTFSFITVQLFNSLLLRRECCSFSNGEYVKAGLGELEHWLCDASQKYVGSSWDELELIRQAVGFLVIHQKHRRTFDEIRHGLCPGLSVQQLYRISTMYWDDKYGTQSVSPEVISQMKKEMAEEPMNPFGSSFLLDDDSSIPFAVEDLLRSMPEVDLANIETPLFLREFLQPMPS